MHAETMRLPACGKALQFVFEADQEQPFRCDTALRGAPMDLKGKAAAGDPDMWRKMVEVAIGARV